MPRRRRRTGGLALVALGLALGGCDPYVQGNGVYLEEERTSVAPFVGLHVEDGVEVTVAAQSAAQRVVVSGDANLVPYIRTEVGQLEGRSVLHVFISEQFDRTIPPRAVVAAQSFEYVRATRGSRVHVRDAGAGSFKVVAAEGAAVDLAGKSGVDPAGETLEVDLDSGAVLDARGYPVSLTASVELGGASTARLRCAGPVTGTVANASLLENVGTGHCAGVVEDEPSTVTCPDPAP